MPANAQILARGSLIRIGSFFINAVILFAMMPFVIRSLGDKMFGLWIFIGSFLDLYGLFDLGFGSAVERYVSRAIGVQDYREANVVINTSLFLFSIIGAITLLFALGTAFLLPLWVKNIMEAALFKQIALILGLSFAFSFPMKVFSGILTSNLRYDLVTSIAISKLLLKTILIIIFLKLGFGILALAFITLFTDLISYLASYIISLKIAGYIVIAKKFIELSRIKTLFQYGIYTFINQIADKLRFGIDNLIITVFLGFSFVTLFSIVSRLITYFIDLISRAINVLIPVFSQYESRGDYRSIREKFIFTTKISGYASILIGGILLIFGKMFIIRWMGQEYKGAYPLLVVLVIPVTIALMQCPSVEVVYGVSKHKFYTVSNTIEGLGNLILSVILVKRFGLMGVALGTAIPMLVIKLFVQPIYTCRIIKLSIPYYYARIIGNILLKSIIILSIFWLIIRNFIIPNYLKLSIQITACLIIFSIVIFLGGLKTAERQYVKRMLIPTNA